MMSYVLDNAFVFAQILGMCAFGLQLIAWQIKSSRLIILIHAPTNFLWCVQFYFLGAYIGCFQALTCGLKDALIAFVRQEYFLIIVFLYLAVNFIAMIYFFSHWYSVFPFLATLTLNIAYLKRDNRALIARAYIVSIACWVIYNFFATAYAVMIGDLIVGVTVFIGMARHEKWKIGRCYRTFLPSIHRALFSFTPRTYP